MQKYEWLRFIIGSVSIPLAVGGFAMLDSHPLVAYFMFTVAGIAFIWGVWPLLFRKRRRKPASHTITHQTPLPRINYEKLKDITTEDKKLIQSMGMRMMTIHGHMDLMGLSSDRANGVPLNELMEKACSECSVPRNKRGRRV